MAAPVSFDPSEREYESESYQLPKDAPEHDRLDAQSKSIIAMMNNKPLHAPVSQPKRILDIGCGTGHMTTLLAKTFPEAKVIGVDIAPVPGDRHGKFDNVEYVRGDVRTLIGTDPRFQSGSFDYVFERFLMFGITEWPTYVAKISTLLSPGGWLEFQEPSMALRTEDGERLEAASTYYPQVRADAMALGVDTEIGSKLRETFQSTKGLDNVGESQYRSHPVERKDHPEMAGLEGQISTLFKMFARRVCGTQRSAGEVEEILEKQDAVLQQGFEPGDHFKHYVVIGQRQG